MLQGLKNPKILIALLFDIVVTIFSFLAALCLRFELLNPFDAPIPNFKLYLVIIVFAQATFFNIMELYKGMWRFSSTTDLIRILKASIYGTSSAFGIIFIWNRLIGFPRSVFIIDLLLVITGLAGGRFFYRMWKDSRETSKNRKLINLEDILNVLIVGAGSAGNQIAKEMMMNPHMGLNLVAFVDDKRSKRGNSIQGVEVLGQSEDIADLVSKLNIQKIFIAVPSATGSNLKRIIEICKNTAVEFKTLPKLNEIISGKVELSLLRNIKLEDLLGRNPVQLSHNDLGKMISDKVIMISGAGGSIGSELCNQISLLDPRKVILFEICELFLYNLEMSLKVKFPHIEYIACIGDVRSKDRVTSVINQYRPHIILHAAAYKHVPMMELNPLEAIFTNVLGTKIVAEAAAEYKCEKFVMISTDKAVNPTNIMGSTKRIAEMICQNLNSQNNETQFITTRFGNVLGSNGSVIPLFKKQIEMGGPVTVTHKDITRYFMSIPEACQLVLQTATMGSGGEIYVLDMGVPVKIVDLAKDLISLSGLRPDEDIEIEYIGLRPGEKLYEELFFKDEQLLETTHERVRRAKSKSIGSYFDKSLDNVLSLKNTSSRDEVYSAIKLIVKEFTSTELENEA